jgi:hypothetical protein
LKEFAKQRYPSPIIVTLLSPVALDICTDGFGVGPQPKGRDRIAAKIQNPTPVGWPVEPDGH